MKKSFRCFKFIALVATFGFSSTLMGSKLEGIPAPHKPILGVQSFKASKILSLKEEAKTLNQAMDKLGDLNASLKYPTDIGVPFVSITELIEDGLSDLEKQLERQNRRIKKNKKELRKEMADMALTIEQALEEKTDAMLENDLNLENGLKNLKEEANKVFDKFNEKTTKLESKVANLDNDIIFANQAISANIKDIKVNKSDIQKNIRSISNLTSIVETNTNNITKNTKNIENLKVSTDQKIN
ncbi:hypothetical protein F1B92_06060, partial [Campylobacter sp. FMV-PI01]